MSAVQANPHFDRNADDFAYARALTTEPHRLTAVLEDGALDMGRHSDFFFSRRGMTMEFSPARDKARAIEIKISVDSTGSLFNTYSLSFADMVERHLIPNHPDKEDFCASQVAIPDKLSLHSSKFPARGQISFGITQVVGVGDLHIESELVRINLLSDAANKKVLLITSDIGKLKICLDTN